MLKVKISEKGKLVLGIGSFITSMLLGYTFLTSDTIFSGLLSGMMFFILGMFLFVEWAYEGREKVFDIVTYKNPINIVIVAISAVSVYFGATLATFNQISPSLQPTAGILLIILGFAALAELFN